MVGGSLLGAEQLPTNITATTEAARNKEFVIMAIVLIPR